MPLMWFNACGRTKYASKTSGSFINPSHPPSKMGCISCPGSSSTLLNSTLRELSAALAAKKLSSVELTSACLARIARHKELNAFISVDESHALAAAKAADENRSGRGNAGDAGPLAGIPIAHKDIFCTRGLRTTCGSRMLENYVSPYDAHVVEQLERAGTVLVGKCNMDEFAMGSSTETSHFGPARNPWDKRLVPGVRRAVEEALRWFESRGASRIELELPNSGLGVPVYYVIAPAEASSNLSRFDGVRYGHRAAEYSDLMDQYCRTRAEGFGAEVKRRILVGTYVLSHGYYDAYYLQAQKVRRLIARDFAQAFERCDVILGPTSPSTAFEIGAKVDDPVQMYLNDIFTVSAPLAGLPALSIPCGFDGAGLPVGLQLTGNYFPEARLLGFAHRYQQETDWHQRVPRETPL